MKKFIFLTFAFLAVGFYEMSGGADFDAVEVREDIVAARIETKNLERTVQTAAAQAPVEQSSADNAVVSRASLDLLSYENVTATESPSRSITPAEVPTPIAASLQEAAEVIPAEPTTLAAYEANRPKVEVIGVATITREVTDISFSGLSSVASSENVALTDVSANAVTDVSANKDMRVVNGSVVNMRSGPGTSFGVIGQLRRDAAVEVLSDSGTGWVKLRPVDGGQIGWIADFLLDKS